MTTGSNVLLIAAANSSVRRSFRPRFRRSVPLHGAQVTSTLIVAESLCAGPRPPPDPKPLTAERDGSRGPATPTSTRVSPISTLAQPSTSAVLNSDGGDPSSNETGLISSGRRESSRSDVTGVSKTGRDWRGQNARASPSCTNASAAAAGTNASESTWSVGEGCGRRSRKSRNASLLLDFRRRVLATACGGCRESEPCAVASGRLAHALDGRPPRVSLPGTCTAGYWRFVSLDKITYLARRSA